MLRELGLESARPWTASGIISSLSARGTRPEVPISLGEGGVVCHVCLTSNVLFGMVPSYRKQPLPRMLDAGVSVTLDADDEYWFGSNIDREFELAREVFGLSLTKCWRRLRRAGTERNGASNATRQRMISGIDRWLNPGPSTPSCPALPQTVARFAKLASSDKRRQSVSA